MHCHVCGAEVVLEAVFCHRCGERLEPAAEDGSSWAGEDDGDAQSASSPAERIKEGMAAHRNTEDEPERELWRGGYSARAMIGAWLLGGLISVALPVLAICLSFGKVAWYAMVIAILLLWLYFFIVLCYRRLNVRYVLTTQKFTHETGILRRVTDRIEVIDMDDITLEQKFLERLVGVGTIRIGSTDRTHPELMLVGIENVKEVAEKLDDNRRAERRRRGLHIESI